MKICAVKNTILYPFEQNQKKICKCILKRT